MKDFKTVLSHSSTRMLWLILGTSCGLFISTATPSSPLLPISLKPNVIIETLTLPFYQDSRPIFVLWISLLYFQISVLNPHLYLVKLTSIYNDRGPFFPSNLKNK